MLAGRSRSRSVSSDSSTSSYNSSSSEDIPTHDITRDTPPRDPLDIDAIVKNNLWNMPYQMLPRQSKDGSRGHDSPKTDVQSFGNRSFPQASDSATANPSLRRSRKIPPSPATSRGLGQPSAFQRSQELGTLKHNVTDAPRRRGRPPKSEATRIRPYPATSPKAGLKEGAGRNSSSPSKRAKKGKKEC